MINTPRVYANFSMKYLALIGPLRSSFFDEKTALVENNTVSVIAQRQSTLDLFQHKIAKESTYYWKLIYYYIITMDGVQLK